MDIPNTGAIFTLGKSYLAENTQSYFYIKNDPVKRLISGPHQSAVICESGRLFVWGENYYGQLGIGCHSSHNNNNNNSKSNNNSRCNGYIITKPTCVKSLKTLGLKIADIAFGNDWSIILTHSNELFFSGRSIFPAESNAARNFTTATVADEQCEIIRKPFRIEELDDCLTKSEDAECYTSVLAGNEHFVLMTSFGRLIAWGSNQNCQLGLTSNDSIQLPHEINLGAPVQQFVCGPESTLVLTTTGKLFFTGHLNEFVFSQFTELQQNLAPTEQIIFMHISKTNEIYIVTNAGSIYRSIESLRTKSLIFQRFYDYDSEENGPIWKLLKGFSFYAVLTKANKFYTTFSESGHHLKTFREISKFKNLRLLDVAVGSQHILVHGIPRTSTISATVGSSSEPHRFASRTFVMPTTLLKGTTEKNQSREIKTTVVENKGNEIFENAEMVADVNSNTMNIDVEEQSELVEKNRETEANAKIINGVQEIKAEESFQNSVPDELGVGKLANEHLSNENFRNKIKTVEVNENKSISEETEGTHLIASTTVIEHNERSSPTGSDKSKKSIHSVKFSPTAANKTSPTSDKLLRPHTPYPESSTTASTPTTIKKTPLRNYSYEAAMDHDHIDRISPTQMDSLDNIPESTETESKITAIKNALTSASSLPFEEDEQLTLEINTTTDPLNSTIVVNEIRFINNGVDVTDNVKAESFEKEDTESTLDSLEEQTEDTDRKLIETPNDSNHSADKIQKAQEGVTGMSSELKNVVSEIETDVEKTVLQQGVEVNEYVTKSKEYLSKQADHIEEDVALAQTQLTSHAENAGKTFTDKIGNAAKKAANAASDVRYSMESAAKDAATGARDAVELVGENAKRAANDAMNTVDSIGSSAKNAETGAKNAVGNMFIKMSDGTKDVVDSVAAKIANEVHDAKENINTMLQGKALKPPPTEEDAISSASDVASKEECAKTNTTACEDDERTTASVNSTQNSTGNPFEGGNPFESTNPFDDIVERGKKALQEEANTFRQEVTQDTEKEKEKKGKVQQFFSDFRGISCRNEKSVEVDDDPPHYSVEDKYPTNRRYNSNQENTSKVCSIL